MLCGSSSNKERPVMTPKSPASTAGNSTPCSESSFDIIGSILRGDLKDDVLVLDKVTWKLPLTTPEDAARLCRSICAVNESFRSPLVSKTTLVAWRLFQASDNMYNGYVTANDLNKIILSALPRMPHVNGPYVDVSDGGNQTFLFWDVLVWWRDLPISDTERQIVHHNVLKRIIVPSDGLWAGVGVSATLRVWSSMCRSSGFLFRSMAESYMQSAFRSVKAQGLPKIDTLKAQLEVVLLLINQAVDRVNKARASCMWRAFMDQDGDDDGIIDSESAISVLNRCKNLPIAESWPIGPPPVSRSSSSSTSLDYQLGKSQDCYSFVQLLDWLMRSSYSSVRPGQQVSLLPGEIGKSNFTSAWTDFWSKLVRPKSPFAPLGRVTKRQPLDSEVIYPVLTNYVKQYLDIEQWRGQFAAELKADMV